MRVTIRDKATATATRWVNALKRKGEITRESLIKAITLEAKNNNWDWGETWPMEREMAVEIGLEMAKRT